LSQIAIMFYIIGLGLSDEKDVTLRGLEVLITSYNFSSSQMNVSSKTGHQEFLAGVSRGLYEYFDGAKGTFGV
jgi:hypothetical protein